jgi:enamine deaminase RidA (YjgF/YER057c/UK114 family)
MLCVWTYETDNRTQFSLVIKLFNISISIGLGRYNYIIVTIFLDYVKQFDSFNALNYNQRFGKWMVKGINSTPYLLNIFGIIKIKNN